MIATQTAFYPEGSNYGFTTTYLPAKIKESDQIKVPKVKPDRPAYKSHFGPEPKRRR